MIIVRLALAYSVIGMTSADMCQDFCMQQLGPAGCSKGSWCKNGRDCHSLFYTGPERGSICVFNGAGSCQNTYPVFCREASLRLGSDHAAASPATTAAPTTVTTVPATTTPATTTTLPVTTTPTSTTRVPVTTAAATTITVPATRTSAPVTTTTVTTTRTPATTTPAPTTSTTTRMATITTGSSSAVSLALHYNPIIADSRPRVNVEFIGSAPGVGFSLMFDTGSDVSHIFQANVTAASLADNMDSYWPLDDADSVAEDVRPAKWMEGYNYVADLEVTDLGRTLHYGVDGAVRPVATAMRLREMANLFSGSTTFMHEIEIHLTTDIDNRATGIGLFGAARTSHFAEAVGVFAFVGPLAAYTGWPTVRAGSLVVGSVEGLERRCLNEAGGIRYVPTRPSVSSLHWAVAGSVGLTGGRMAPVDWIVDTGAEGLFVTAEVLDDVVAGIVGAGAIVQAAEPRQYSRIFNCPSNFEDVFPTITIRVGADIDVTAFPSDYIIVPDDAPGICFLKLGSNGVSGRANVKLLGIQSLTKMVTVFDRRNDRLGFCIARN